MHRVLIFAIAVVLTAMASCEYLPSQIEFENYPSQLEKWENEVQDMVLNGPSDGSVDIESLEENNSPIQDGHDLGDDYDEEDPEMHFGEDEEEEEEAPSFLINNLELSSNTEESDEQEATTDANQFSQFRSIESMLSTQDYIDLRVPDYVHYDEEGKGSAVYTPATAEEVKDAISLARRMYEPHEVVEDSDSHVQAEIYIRKLMKKEVSDPIAVNNLQIDVMEDLNHDWALVQQKFKGFAQDVRKESTAGVKKLADWGSAVRLRMLQTASKFKKWAHAIKNDSKSKWVYLQRQAKNVGKTLRNLFVCQLEQHKYVNLPLNENSGISPDATAHVVFRGQDAVNDWVNNFKHMHVPCSSKGCRGRVHHGFKECYDSIRNNLFKKIAVLAKSHNIKRIVISGYSLGGALAVLHGADASSAYPAVSFGLLSFGQPRVGDKDFAAFVDQKMPNYPRIVAKFHKATCDCHAEERSDYVTSLPKEISGFAHAGLEFSVPCFTGACNTRCCPQNVINQIKCHSLEKYVHSTWSALA